MWNSSSMWKEAIWYIYYDVTIQKLTKLGKPGE